jgi:hypothetical protein
MKPSPRRRLAKDSRAGLLWALGLFVLGQAVLGVWLHRRHPEMCDPTFEFRYNRLEQCLHQAPGSPLVLVVGSSRPATGFSPTALADWRPRQGPAPVVFNYAVLGGGPVRDLLIYRRLLARGIRPDLLLVEVWPVFWSQECVYAERASVLEGDLHLCDLPVLAHQYQQGWAGFTKVCEQTLSPLLHNRLEFLNAYAPFLLHRNAEAGVDAARMRWRALDPWGWLPITWPKEPAEAFAAKLEEARRTTQPGLANFQWSPEVDWTVRRLLDTCQEQGTRVVFFLMPEHSSLRSWYTPRTHAVVHDHLLRLEKEFGTPIVEARDWVADEDFADYCHLLPSGAEAFSARFGREALRPLLEGSPLPAHLRLRTSAEAPTYSGAAAAPGVLP